MSEQTREERDAEIEGLKAEITRLKARLETAWRMGDTDAARTLTLLHERDEARATIARVEALAAEWCHVGGGSDMGSAFASGYNAALRAQADTVRAALATQPTEARP